MNFAHTSPFKKALPPISNIFEEPITFVRTWMSVLNTHYMDANQKAFESRARAMDDVIKRQAFQKAHGTEKGPMERYFGFGKKDPDEGEEQKGNGEKAA